MVMYFGRGLVLRHEHAVCGGGCRVLAEMALQDAAEIAIECGVELSEIIYDNAGEQVERNLFG